MTVVVVLSVSFFCFLQCHSGETASICQPEVLSACEQGKGKCCPKLENTFEASTQKYEPYETTISQPQFESYHDENIIKETTSNYIDENVSFNFNSRSDFKPDSSHETRELDSFNYSGQKAPSLNNRKHNVHPNSGSNRAKGVPNETSKCETNFSCVPVKECDINYDEGDLLYPCNNRRNVCCSRLKNRNSNDKTTQKYEPFNTINPNSIKPEKYHNGDVNILTINHRERVPNSNTNSGEKPDDEETFLQDFKNKENNKKYDSDNIIFSEENINTSDVNRSTLLNDINKNIEQKNSAQITRNRLFSKNCGITLAHDKITGGKIAEIGQFPWMALLGFKHPSTHSLQFLCGGSLITTRHVLTAAHCIIENRQLELRSIRLGEYNLTTERDCVQYGKDEVCADHYVDVAVEQVILHPNFNRQSLKNDIAIIRIKKDVEISEYISTICLPFDKDYSNVNMTGQNFTVSGWGKSSSGNLFGTDVIQYAKVTTWNPIKCNNSLPSEVKPLSITQLCANGANSEDSCKGDSGGPLINVTLDKDLELRHIQFGVVSFGTGTCGDKNLPTIYTRVDQYLQWILKIVS